MEKMEQEYQLKDIELSENLRWYDVPELQPKTIDDTPVDAEENPISFNGIIGLRPVRCKIEYTPEMLREIYRCKEDYIYFIENYVQLNTYSGFTFIKLRDYQKEILYRYFTQSRVILMMSRQAAKTTTTALYVLYSIIFGKDLSFGIAANLQKMSIEVLNIIKESYLSLPVWLQQGIKIWNAGSIVLENKCKIKTAATTPTAFRGLTFSSEYLLKRKTNKDLLLASTLLTDECVEANTLITIRNKKTGEIKKIPIKELEKLLIKENINEE